MSTSAVVSKRYSDRAILRDGPFGLRYYAIVYVVEALKVGRLKFGRTLKLDRRFGSLCAASPIPLVLRGHIWLPDDAEADIHSYLRDDRSHGEWFVATERCDQVAGLIATKSVRELAEVVGIRGYRA